jgi:hypothetical protein
VIDFVLSSKSFTRLLDRSAVLGKVIDSLSSGFNLLPRLLLIAYFSGSEIEIELRLAFG